MIDRKPDVPSPQNREEALFQAAVQLTGAERASFLNGACLGDPVLRQRLEALLSAHDAPDELSPNDKSTAVATMKIEFSDAPDEAVGQTLGRYKLLERVGEGGCGVVYVAEQTEPVRRRVALKVIKLGMDTKQVVARFEAERQALAMMDHPNIAKVLDAGTTDVGRPFFVMELVRGIKITDYCDQASLSTKERLDLFIKVCHAIQHAHQKGIIHRDIKPSNILVTLHDGAPVPKVIDFGIAKATEGRLTDATVYTQLHQFIGTPAYMSPEQAEMSGLDIDTRSDIYSLGVLLYELLAGSTPFDAKELMAGGIDAMRKTIREKEPPRPSTRLATLGADQLTTTAKRRSADTSKLLHQLKGDLDWIVMKCLEKDRQRRYETANGLAADLKRHLNNEPVVARPPSTAYRFHKAFRRNKLAFTAATAVAAALLVGISASVWQAARATKAKIQADASRQAAQASEQKAVAAQANEAKLREQANAARQQAQAAELAAQRQAYASDMNGVQAALATDNLGRARALLDRHRPEPGEVDLRGWEWRYLWQFCRSDATAILKEPNDNSISSLAVSGDGQWLAAGGLFGGELFVLNLATKEKIRVPAGAGNVRVAFSPRAPLLAIGIDDRERGMGGSAANLPAGRVLLWDATTRKIMREISLTGACNAMAFSSDGQTLATVDIGRESTISLWRVADGAQVARWPGGSGNLSLTTSFATTPDLNFAAFPLSGRFRGVRVLDLRTGQGRDVIVPGPYEAGLALSPDGTMLATTPFSMAVDSTIQLWEVGTGRGIGRLDGHRGRVGQLIFLPDGKQLLSASADQTLRLWDVGTRTAVRTFRGHKTEVWTVQLMSDQRSVVSGSKDGSVYRWDLQAGRETSAAWTIERGRGGAWAFAGGGEFIVDVDTEGRVTRRQGRTFQEERPLFDLGSTVAGAAFDQKRPLLAVATAAEKVQVWDWERRQLVREFPVLVGSQRAVPQQFSRDGASLSVRLSSGPELFAYREWEIATGRETRSFDFPLTPSSNFRGTYSPDGTKFAHLVYPSGEGQLLDLQSGRATPLKLNVREPMRPRFSTDGGLLAVPSLQSSLRIFDVAANREVAALRGYMFGVHSANISPDGSRFVSGGTGVEAVALWDAQSHERLLTLAAKTTNLSSVEFSPDGNVLVGGLGGDSTLFFWRAPSWAEIEQAEAKEKAEGKQP